MTSKYEWGKRDGMEEGLAAVRVLLKKLEAAQRDSEEWKQQHENLLAMFRAAEQRAIKAEHRLREYVSSGWISVAERLPKDDAPVLIAYRAQFKPRKSDAGGSRWSIITARYSGGEWRFLTTKQKNRLPERITHWMPLPGDPSTASPLPTSPSIDALLKAAQNMVDSFGEHADRCRPCAINWQNLKKALQDVTVS